jgi:hypothetical protein
MRMYHIDDPRTEAYLLKVEEMLAEARAFSARRALLRDARPPRRKARVWLGSILLVVGHRLLQSVPGPAASGVGAPAEGSRPSGS